MTNLKDHIIRIIQRDAAGKVGELAGQLIRAPPEEKEAILAELEFEQWLEQCCRECLS